MEQKILTTLLLFVFCVVQGFSQNKETFNSYTAFGFIENKGQIHDQNYKVNQSVKYLFPTGKGLNVQLKKNGFSYDFYRLALKSTTDQKIAGTKKVIVPKHTLNLHRIDIDFLNSNPNAVIEAVDQLPTYLQFQQQGEVQQYQKVIYKNIYPMIDVVFYANQTTQQMKYDFIVHPGGDYHQIKLSFKGYTNGKLVDDHLQLSHSLGTVNEVIPDSWVEESGKKVDVNYTVFESKAGQIQVGFHVNNYDDLGQTLVIDPEPLMVWGTYLGDSLVTITTSVTTDKNGFIYTCGTTQAMHSLATTNSYQVEMTDSIADAFIMKFNQYGICLWASYFGGNNLDVAMDVVADTMGHVYLYGTTYSDTNIVAIDTLQDTVQDSIQDSLAFTPIQDTLFGLSDVFLVKFKKNGTFIWSTYYGGAGEEEGVKMSLDFKGNVFLTGTTQNSPTELGTIGSYQPTSSGEKDAFITKIDTAGAIVWSTYYGGTFNDVATGISYGDTNVYVCGYTNSIDLISTDSTHQDSIKGMIDGYISKFDPLTGQKVWGTYFGGSENDYVNGIKAYNDVIYFVGTTLSEDYIASDSMQYQFEKNGLEDAFIGRVMSDSGSVMWSTYYGGDSSDYGIDLDIEMDKKVFLLGTTLSDSLIASDSTQQNQIGGGKDVFLSKFETYGFRMWGTYYGGAMDDEAYGVDVFGNTSIYVVGSTQSDSVISDGQYYLPYQDSLMGITDGFLTKFIQNFTTMPGGFGGGTCVNNTLYVCEGDTAFITLMGAELGIDAVWAWYKNDCGGDAASLGFGDTLIFFPTEDFVLFVRAETVTNSTDCMFINVVVAPKPTPVITSADHFCSDNEYVFTSNALAGETVQWSGPNTFFSTELQPSLLVTDETYNGVYELELTNQFGCSDTTSIDLVMLESPQASYLNSDVTCFNGQDGSVTIEASGTAPFIYILNGMVSPNNEFPNLFYGGYTYLVIDSFGCKTGDSLYINQPNKIIFSATITSDSCELNSGSSYVFIDSSYTDYDVTWLPSAIYGDSAYGLGQGEQTAYVTLPNGCSDSITVEIPVQYEVVINASPDSIALFLGETINLASTCNYDESIVSIAWTPVEGVECDSCANTSATPLDSSEYIVLYTHTSGCFSSDTVKITIKKPCGEIFIPTAFSPNNDGLNDQWCVMGGCIASIKIVVFNQWGETIFATSNTEECWDGKFQGELVQNDSYVYQIEVTTINGETVSENGSVEVNQ